MFGPANDDVPSDEMALAEALADYNHRRRVGIVAGRHPSVWLLLWRASGLSDGEFWQEYRQEYRQDYKSSGRWAEHQIRHREKKKRKKEAGAARLADRCARWARENAELTMIWFSLVNSQLKRISEERREMARVARRLWIKDDENRDKVNEWRRTKWATDPSWREKRYGQTLKWRRKTSYDPNANAKSRMAGLDWLSIGDEAQREEARRIADARKEKRNLYARAWRAQNKDRVNESQRRYRLVNAEKVKEWQRRYYERRSWKAQRDKRLMVAAQGGISG